MLSHNFNNINLIKCFCNLFQNGFDYILTYYDDPQAVFPSPAYNWMARTGRYSIII